MAAIPIVGRPRLTGRRRCRAGWFGRLILQVEEERPTGHAAYGETHWTGSRASWRDAKVGDLTDDDALPPADPAAAPKDRRHRATLLSLLPDAECVTADGRPYILRTSILHDGTEPWPGSTASSEIGAREAAPEGGVAP